MILDVIRKKIDMSQDRNQIISDGPNKYLKKLQDEEEQQKISELMKDIQPETDREKRRKLETQIQSIRDEFSKKKKKIKWSLF